jgi:hypothetical protein
MRCVPPRRTLGAEVSKSGHTSITARPIGDDPEALGSLHPGLHIWDAYETVHVLMPDGSMKLGGEAVAEVLQNLPNTKWIARSFPVSILRPFQMILNLAYAILADVRPFFGCESCGTSSFWVRSIGRIVKWTKAIFGQSRDASPHFTPGSATAGRR